MSGARLRMGMDCLSKGIQNNDARVWIVSASPQIVVEVLADRLGVPVERVLAVLSSPDGRQISRFPWRETKVQVLQAAGAECPLMVFGDSMDDYKMLAAAQHAVVVGDGKTELVNMAHRLSWMII